LRDRKDGREREKNRNLRDTQTEKVKRESKRKGRKMRYKHREV